MMVNVPLLLEPPDSRPTLGRPEWFLAIIFALGLVGANVGASEYLSVPFICVISLMLLTLIGQQWRINTRVSIVATFGFLLSIMPASHLVLRSEDWHSALTQFRELFFVVALVVVAEPQSIKFRAHALVAYKLSTIVVASLVVVQFIQISAGQLPTTIPQSWLMIDYTNSLQTALANNFSYLRPVALFSEPSVVASLLVPGYYLAMASQDRLWSLICFVGTILSGSLFGMIGVLVVTVLVTKRNWPAVIVASCAVLVLSVEFFGDRIERILFLEDMSFQWRVTLPLAFLEYRLEDSPFWPMPLWQIYSLAENHFQNASITDTWPLYTLIRLGLPGLVWVIFCVAVMPANLRIVFCYFALISGSPLYQDKVWMMMVFFLALANVRERRLGSV